MFKRKIIGLVGLALLALAGSHALFAQATIGGAVSNAAREVSERVPDGARIAVLNISSNYPALSDFIINELILSLVRAGSFQVVPRSTVELEMAQQEFDFQMGGLVSDADQRRLGQFLGVDTFVTGSIARETANTYRLMVNAIHLESFTFQAAYGAPVRIDNQMRTLIAGGGGDMWFDYTTGQRIGMGAANMFFGIGSLLNGHRSGWIVAGVQGTGVVAMAPGLALAAEGEGSGLIGAGVAIIGGAIVIGYILPFFHTRPNPAVASAGSGLPFGFELVSGADRGISGARMVYTRRF